jgi:hypothetical protein
MVWGEAEMKREEREPFWLLKTLLIMYILVVNFKVITKSSQQKGLSLLGTINASWDRTSWDSHNSWLVLVIFKSYLQWEFIYRCLKGFVSEPVRGWKDFDGASKELRKKSIESYFQ